MTPADWWMVCDGRAEAARAERNAIEDAKRGKLARRHWATPGAQAKHIRTVEDRIARTLAAGRA